MGTVRDGDFAEERENMERIVAGGDADAVVAVLSDVDALDEPIRQLADQGVPVVLVNSKDPRPAEEQVPHLRYAGADTYLTGVRNAQLALASFTELAGRAPKRSTYIEHVPGAWVLVTRGQGMSDVLTPEGTNFESIAGEVDPVDAVSAATGGAMADFAFDFSGSAVAMNQTVGVVRNGGMVVLEGAGPPGTQLVADQAELIDNEKVITGAHAGGGIPALDIPLLIDRFRTGTFKLDALVSHRLSLKEVNDGFDLMTRGEARRSVIVPCRTGRPSLRVGTDMV